MMYDGADNEDQTMAKITDTGAWREASRALLADEKAATAARDALAAKRRELPWLHMSDDYRFDTGAGSVGWDELFDGHQQLVIYHFMYGTDWDEGCPTCSFWADSFDGSAIHLAARDTAFACVSEAAMDKLDAYKARMGWSFRWYSSAGTSFGHDLGVSHSPGVLATGDTTYNHDTAHPMGDVSPGLSAFIRDDDGVWLTYQTFARGLEAFNATYGLLDLTALGRHEDDLPFTMAWLRRHDAYGTG